MTARSSRSAAAAPPPGKIVFVNRFYDPDESATSQMLTDLARALAARSKIVHVVCSRQRYTDAAAELPALEARCGVQIHRIPTTRFGRQRLLGRAIDYASFYLAATWTLLRFISTGDVLVVKTDPPLLSIPSAAVARLKGAALVNWQQDVFPEIASHLGAHPLPRWVHAALQRLRDASLRTARMNVAIGRRMREYVQSCGVPEARVCVIENWADTRAIMPKPAVESGLRTRLGLGDRFVVGYSGNLGRAHEFETVLEAASLLESDPSIVFLVIGDGAGMVALRHAVNGRGLKNFCFAPYQPRKELSDSLAAADVHWVSLRAALEGLILPSKVYGILAAGRPIVFIGAEDGDIAQLCLEGCGYVVAPGAPAKLVEVIKVLQASSELRAALGSRARELCVSRYTLEHATARWVSVLEELSARGSEIAARRPAQA